MIIFKLELNILCTYVLISSMYLYEGRSFLFDAVHHANTAAARQCRNFSAHLAKCVWEIRILCRSSRYCHMHRHPFETVVKLNKQAMEISVH